MKRTVSPKFCLEAATATATAVALILFLGRPDWIEAVLPVDPDAHSGSLELLIVVLLGLLTIIFGVLARRSWRAGRTAPISSSDDDLQGMGAR